ncbi:MAG: DUF551 domain-containing protein [Lachnospiraceae bacterium]|nr:DUF551 domain-containing protein [Lachnospiraceae bacterium]
MGTLTFCNEDGTWGLKNYDITKAPSELYGAICKLKDYEGTGLAPEQILEIDKLYRDRLKEIEDLKQRLAAGFEWIPCSERLPEDSYSVLICGEPGYIDSGWYKDGHWWTGFSFADIKKDIVAWRPLPEPYQQDKCEKGEDKDE